MTPGNINLIAALAVSAAPATTWNPSDQVNMTFSGGNLTVSESSSSQAGARATVGKSSGKFYFEITAGVASGLDWQAGLSTAAANLSNTPLQSGEWIYRGNGIVFDQGSSAGTYSGISTSNVLMVAVDLTAGRIWFGINGTWFNSGNPAAGTGYVLSPAAGTTLYPSARSATSNAGTNSWQANFGATSFAYTPPSGFSAWN